MARERRSGRAWCPSPAISSSGWTPTSGTSRPTSSTDWWGPLLTNKEIGYVKGYYRRPLFLGEMKRETGGGRVTEICARPLINMFYPDLAGLIQPLSGEYAGRRSVLESVPFFTGYGVEIGLDIDIYPQIRPCGDRPDRPQAPRPSQPEHRSAGTDGLRHHAGGFQTAA